MSFKDYVQHMTHKYRLAVAIAVLKNKPENKTIEQYIEQLQEKIKENDTDDDVLCSNDFNIDDTDFNFDDDAFNCDENDVLMTNEVPNSIKVNEVDTRNDDNNSINILLDVANTMGAVGDRNNQISKDYNVNHNSHTESNAKKGQSNTKVPENEVEVATDGQNMEPTEADNVIDILRTLRDIEGDMDVENDTIFGSVSQTTYFESSQADAMDTYIHINTDDNITFSAHEDFDIHILNRGLGSQDMAENPTSLNERIIANVIKNLNKDNALNANKKSSIKDVNKIAHDVNNTNDETNKTKDVIYNNSQGLEDDILRYDSENVSEISLNNDFLKDKADIVAKNISKVNKNDFHNVKSTFRDKEEPSYKNINDNTPITTDNTTEKSTQDSQETIIYTLQGFTQNTGHISQSQCQNINIPDRYIFGKRDTILKENALRDFSKDNNGTQPVNKEVITHTNVKELTNTDIAIQDNQITKIDSTQIQYIIDKSGKTYAVLKEIQINNNSQRKDFNNTSTHEVKGTNLELPRSNKELEETQVENARTNMDYEGLGENTLTNTEYQIKDNFDIDLSNSQQEIVPFKVVKELSKIKAYLNRRERIHTDGFSSDSGYRSDSQHSSYKSAHLSDNWVHQSAHCLYNYVLHCPLVAGTQDIVSEISLVLGNLIDKLHEEEKYPPFIEELLATLDKLLNDLYHGGGGCDNILLEKDETIQRIFLLNKSSHILKYSIEKITNTLEDIHTHLSSQETLYELTNIQETENITYIFYVLEILLQKYIKSKTDFQSQSQSSQEGKVIKKSSIADIWRKKWNSKFKENSIEGSQKMCVLVKCGDVLNKIIVACIEGYSLVAFAALQCFNLLQG